jgi:Zn-dependent M16 (insulinase) family peptidase
LNQLPHLQELMKKNASYWIELLSTYVGEQKPHMVLRGRPSTEQRDKVNRAEEERVEKQKIALGEDGLRRKAAELDAAINANRHVSSLQSKCSSFFVFQLKKRNHSFRLWLSEVLVSTS